MQLGMMKRSKEIWGEQENFFVFLRDVAVGTFCVTNSLRFADFIKITGVS